MVAQRSKDDFGSLGKRPPHSGASIVKNPLFPERTQNSSKVLLRLGLAGNDWLRLLSSCEGGQPLPEALAHQGQVLGKWGGERKFDCTGRVLVMFHPYQLARRLSQSLASCSSATAINVLPTPPTPMSIIGISLRRDPLSSQLTRRTRRGSLVGGP